VSPKKNSQHFPLSLENQLTDFDIFGINIPDATCHQMTTHFFTSPIVCAQGKQINRNIHLNKQKNLKKHL